MSYKSYPLWLQYENFKEKGKGKGISKSKVIDQNEINDNFSNNDNNVNMITQSSKSLVNLFIPSNNEPTKIFSASSNMQKVRIEKISTNIKSLLNIQISLYF